MLDSGPLGLIAHHRPRPDITRWVNSLLAASIPVYIPEICDYEIRRNLISKNLRASLAVLDELPKQLTYRPITTAVIRHAAQLWADARRRGTPTADPKELDADVILAAQALEADAIIVTDNVAHIAQFVLTATWQSVQPTP
jgi:predicted nucleic acid-binding protein